MLTQGRPVVSGEERERATCECRKPCHLICDLGIFVDQAAEPVSAHNAYTGHFRRRVRAPCGRVLLQCPMRPVDVVVIGVLAEDQPQVPLTGDQQAVQALAAGTDNPSFGDRVHPGRPDAVLMIRRRLR